MTKLKPFLQWVGGKRQLIPVLESYIPKNFNTYYEPFIGGGSLLFHLSPSNAVINDYNEELINCYLIIKNQLEELINDLKKHKNEKEYYYFIRNLDRKDNYNKLSNVEKASRFIYLNKTCFNAIHRVNSKGQFNVPFANYKNPLILDIETLTNIHHYLNKNKIHMFSGDYKNILSTAKEGDFVYLDPPYDPISDTASFTNYSTFKFNKDEQKKLKEICDELTSRKCFFMQSNSYTNFILDLYQNYRIEVITVNRNISAKNSSRGKVNEVLILNY